MDVIEIRNLNKNFGPITAVKDLTLNIRKGEIFGFLGPNGAGKSTTINAILGLIQPDSGEIRIFNKDLKQHRKEILNNTGVLIENATLFPYLSGRKNLRALSYLLGVDKHRIEEVLGMVGLLDRADSKFNTYSLGMKQRLGIAAALLNDPDLLILDEPSNGLDPSGMHEMRMLIKNLAAQGKTIFLASHLLYEVQLICDTIGIINRGVLIKYGKKKDLLTPPEEVKVKIQIKDMDQTFELIKSFSFTKNVKQMDDYILVTMPNTFVNQLSEELGKKGFYPTLFQVEQISLEEIYLKTIGEISMG